MPSRPVLNDLDGEREGITTEDMEVGFSEAEDVSNCNTCADYEREIEKLRKEKHTLEDHVHALQIICRKRTSVITEELFIQLWQYFQPF